MFLAIIIDMVATSTLCLNVYSSLVFNALISTAIAALSLIALLRSFVILVDVLAKFTSLVLLYKYCIPVETLCLRLSESFILDGSSHLVLSIVFCISGGRGGSAASGAGSSSPSLTYMLPIPNFCNDSII